ncbi:MULTISPECIES: HaeII family restriction endonuclease [unclassified Acinetobacter]|uniref:HaeII family restriction endonuclease n=1 Tax=unclassified Acinetobacter TaxID=196816 RepID=UPI0015D423B8|nr:MULTISPECIES: HaeII family restriction endonuclease [unclassified Acinetobacter]
MTTVLDAKLALDSLVAKSRAHLYKPMQIAEILRKYRLNPEELNPLELETYRTQSKKWRDAVTSKLVGNVSTSSARFQDNLFEENAIPPRILEVLAKENNGKNGAIEAYIYTLFAKRLGSVSNSVNYCLSHDSSNFKLDEFMDSFWKEPGLKRSIDKVFECVVYALFSSIVEAIDAEITLSYNTEKKFIIEEFEDFTKAVLNISVADTFFKTNGSVHRIGATNAADRGLDIWTNFGVIVQIKHLSLSEELAEGICNSLTADRIVIVCKKADAKVITSLLNQIGWKSKIQSIITEDQLIQWYEKALRGQYANLLSSKLLLNLQSEIQREFPATLDDNFLNFYKERNYHLLPTDDLWLTESGNAIIPKSI